MLAEKKAPFNFFERRKLCRAAEGAVFVRHANAQRREILFQIVRAAVISTFEDRSERVSALGREFG